ncbi:kinase non-catalytic C-lobe domain-containing protein 1 isoform X2 [Trichomycterus rosablanca]|uniref:kinase non-catalytic C-lobe domain-containing protein 1 isoform X2 n=1 Tax=Trichomycterus rosablanca TaxID=2290929 RepID=UPI002F353F9C
MSTSDGGEAALGGEGEDEEEERSKVDRLPPLMEDEENVSLADILCLRDSCLSEQEVWAVCVECVRSLQSILRSPLFHSLCITPDTLAFNAHGNVCFIEQLSDDPEDSFVAPEFGETGNTFESHVFSLGSTLSAAVGFVIEPELEAELGDDTHRLFEQMQEEKPENRPSLQDIISLAKAKFTDTSTTAVCRKLSAIGRRVLSIESVSPFQDDWEKPYHHFMEYNSSSSNLAETHICDHRMAKHYSSDSHDDEDLLVNHRRTVYNGSFRSGSVDEYSGGPMTSFNHSQISSPVLRINQERRWRRSRSALNRSCSIPDSNNPPVFSASSHTNLSMMVEDLSEIGGEESRMMHWGDQMLKETPRKCGQVADLGGNEGSPDPSMKYVNSIEHVGNIAEDTGQGEVVRNETPVFLAKEEVIDNSHLSSNHITKSMLCLKEESQDEWISLRELLLHCSRPLSVNELWALCYTCLATLQTYIDFPAYLCLDSVYVSCDGELLFLKPKSTEFTDAFYIAPEFQEHGIVTEKACIYGVAAVLWSAAKFHLSPNQKLPMPRKLKRLLLDMAKRTPIERPSIVMAKKICGDYLSHQGIDVETVWIQLIDRLHKAPDGINEVENMCNLDIKTTVTPESKSGFVPLAQDARLAPVAGPVPQTKPFSMMARLPLAFTSSATHFSPIVVTHEGGRQEESPLTDPGMERDETLTPETPLQQDWMLDEGVHEEDHCPSLSSSRTFLSSSLHSTPQTVKNNEDANIHTLPTCPSISCSTGVYNNFLLQQDPQSGCLTLFPVQIAQPITDLDLRTVSKTAEKQDSNVHHVTHNGKSEQHDLNEKKKVMLNNKAHLDTTDITGQKHLLLQQVIGLLREEFAFDGYLENGVEELVMGEYILSLTNLQFETFCRAIAEKFSDLHWDTDLLGLLHCLVKRQSSLASTKESLSGKKEERALTLLPDNRRVEVDASVNTERGQLDHNANECQTLTDGQEHKDNKIPNQGETEGTLAHKMTEEYYTMNTCKETQAVTMKKHHNSTMKNLDMESSASPAGGADESVCESEAVCPSSDLEQSAESLLTPDCSDADMDDSESCTGPQGPSFRPAWPLALYGEDFFNQEVVEYAYKLGGHSDSPSFEDKLQELQQQLMLESRNLKKTRNFYHKLIHQERKNKGSDAKAMLPKLKAQLDELRTKVEFLDSVRQYLQVLCVDQWGLPLSLLPSLASSDSSAVDLRASEDPSILSLVCEQRRTRGCCPLLAGTPKGLMAYLYARNAHLEGYIQHFLYTYRYFCTPEDFLQFLMNKFHSSVGNKNSSKDSAKVYHRTLDVLECWTGDCRSVDFTSSSRLQQMLDNFLTSEVAPVESRGERLLTMLQSSPKKRRGCKVSCLSEGPINSWEDVDVQSVHSICRQSSVEGTAKKSFHWPVSRVVEPQANQSKEKAFSIAAALPRPCYNSLLSQVTGVCVRNEDRVAFNQTDYNPLNTAQQLTLLQQEIFQSCHPVNFLNSRAQGVREKTANISKSVPTDTPPPEGNNLFVSDEQGSNGPLQHLIRYSESVSTWVSAEIVITDSLKVQAALLAKFLLIAKRCYEMRNFATAMQILGGLDNVIVRQLPAWKQLSAKMSEVLEELRAVQVFLKSDSLCLMEGERGKRQPTLPDAHILAMHLQQLEIGAFTLTSGAYKWPKLRSIARVVSQVHAFQEHVFLYPPDLELQSYLQARITHLSACDVSLLAADNDTNFNQPTTERQTRRIQDTLRRVKASFQ